LDALLVGLGLLSGFGQSRPVVVEFRIDLRVLCGGES
jgi:hypothetical protein